MQRKSYELLIIKKPQPTILHIQTRGVGGMGRWGDGRAVIGQLQSESIICPKGIIPFPQSPIPPFPQVVSAAN